MNNRMLVILTLVTIVIQGAIMYRQHSLVSAEGRTDRVVNDAFPDDRLDISGLPVLGSQNAQVVILEISDYDCPFCARHANYVAENLKAEFVTTGKVRLVFVNAPSPSHTNARFFAVAAICAGDQGQYWKMHDNIFREAPKTTEAILDIARNSALDEGKFQACIKDSELPAQRIEKDKQIARDLRVTGTPTFAIGRVDPHGVVTLEKIVIGAQPLIVFEKVINAVLAKT